MSSVEGMLLDGEEVVKEWATKEWYGIYATRWRLFFVRDSMLDKTVVEVPYSHICSLEYGRNHPSRLLWSALVTLLFYLLTVTLKGTPFISTLLDASVLRSLQIFLLLISAGMLVWFYVGREEFTIYITGRDAIHVSKELRELYKLVRS